MKIAALLLGVALAGPLSSLAGPPKGSMLMSAESFAEVAANPPLAVARGNALALIGNFRVQADEIFFDQPNSALVCRGVTSITPGFSAAGAKDVTIPVVVDNIYRLEPKGIVLNSRPSGASTSERLFNRIHPGLPKLTPEAGAFSTGLPKLDLNLSSQPPR